ncbi:ZIP family metal transporter [Mucisphaera calidilacus]|uniref:Zinc transporter ZupT n=1 Tax=Mucisphaera calidilacus TaxID=2527982 RepID=A0A518BVK8_9BACT|nr:ZIP family metal transporter [Mucisphaera calidilacus]QDU71009.1 Zinc transporter ZupT [Mucisphaera calidilacus]
MEPTVPIETVVTAVVAGILASLACGLGVLPLCIPRLNLQRHIGIGYALAGGLMFSASVYNLIYEGLKINQIDLYAFQNVWPVVLGILAGALFLSIADTLVHNHTDNAHASGQPTLLSHWGGRTGILVFIAMTVHSIPEGVAVGTGFALQDHPHYNAEGVGTFIAIAIAIHNIPEGLAVAIPLRSAGVSLARCFAAAVITSLPQPIAAIPAVMLAWFFEPLMPALMGFAAGAMIFLVIVELIPEALQTESPKRIAWSFVAGFCAMILIQVLL